MDSFAISKRVSFLQRFNPFSDSYPVAMYVFLLAGREDWILELVTRED